jgi:hypothetical protein
MTNELSNGSVRPPSMTALTEPEDPDCRVHAAWLAQVSKAGDGLRAKEASGSTSTSTSSLDPTDRFSGQEVPLAPEHLDRKSDLIAKAFIGGIFVAVIAAVVAISYLPFLEIGQQPKGNAIELTSPDAVKSAAPSLQTGSETPKLLVGPKVGAPGEPVLTRAHAAGRGQ